MRASIPILLEATYAAWAARDLDSTMACFADDVLFAIHLPDNVPFGGVVHGRTALREVLKSLIDTFDFLEYRPVQITASGGSFHSQVYFHYRHKATGLRYEGKLRHVWHIEGDKIVHFEEFHDAQRTRAFFEVLKLYEKDD